MDSESNRSGYRVELVLTIIMAISAVGTAWAGFQSTKWGGVQANSYAQASAARTESTRASTEAGQLQTIDVISFSAWVEALNTEIIAGTIPVPAGSYRPTPGTGSAFFYHRFRPEFRPAVEAWIAARPLIDPAAPPTPFALPEYRLASGELAAQLADRADRHADRASTANQRADNYVLTAVIFALVLFFAGVAGRAHARIQYLMTALAATALLAALITLATFPVEV